MLGSGGSHSCFLFTMATFNKYCELLVGLNDPNIILWYSNQRSQEATYRGLYNLRKSGSCWNTYNLLNVNSNIDPNTLWEELGQYNMALVHNPLFLELLLETHYLWVVRISSEIWQTSYAFFIFCIRLDSAMLMILTCLKDKMRMLKSSIVAITFH